MKSSDNYELAQTIKKLETLEKGSIGIGMMIASILLLFVYIVAWMLLVQISLSISRPAIAVYLLRIQLGVGVPVFLISSLLSTIGPCFCLAASRQTKSTIFILLSIIASALSLVLRAVLLVGENSGLFTRTANLLPLLAVFFFLLFLIRLAAYLDRYDIVKLAKTSLALGVTALVFSAMPFVSRYAVLQINLTWEYITYLPFVTGFSLFIVLITSALAFLRYLRALMYSRRALLGAPPPKPMSVALARAQMVAFGALVGGLGGSMFYFVPLSRSRQTAMNPVLTILAWAIAGVLLTWLIPWLWRVFTSARPPQIVVSGVVGLMLGLAVYLPFIPALGWNPLFPSVFALSGTLLGTLIGILQQLRGQRTAPRQDSHSDA